MKSFLTEDFNAISEAVWKQKIQFELEGADYQQTLMTQTNEGITIKPFYHLDGFEKLAIPDVGETFKICQEIQVSSEAKANLKALDAIKGGATSLKFQVVKPFNPKVLFKGLLNKKIEFQIEMKFLSKTFLIELDTFLKNETVFLNIDIIGQLARHGNWYNNLHSDFNIVSDVLSKHHSEFPLGVHTGIYQNSGATTVQQVAYALAHANEYLTNFGGDITQKIQFNFAIGANYFFEISKLRAFKYLYGIISNEYGNRVNPNIYATPSVRNKTLYDYNTNMLRTTTESMSAIIGGAHTISNCAYDVLFHHSNDFGDRIARNQLLILKEESFFKNASQAAKDSYYIESITKQIAEKALILFKDIEKNGGFLKQLKSGTIQRKIKESAQKEQAQFDKKDMVLVGTNKYLNKKDFIKNNLDFNPFAKKSPYKTLIIPIVPKRLSERHEQRRMKNET